MRRRLVDWSGHGLARSQPVFRNSDRNGASDAVPRRTPHSGGVCPMRTCVGAERTLAHSKRPMLRSLAVCYSPLMARWRSACSAARAARRAASMSCRLAATRGSVKNGRASVVIGRADSRVSWAIMAERYVRTQVRYCRPAHSWTVNLLTRLRSRREVLYLLPLGPPQEKYHGHVDFPHRARACC